MAASGGTSRFQARGERAGDDERGRGRIKSGIFPMPSFWGKKKVLSGSHPSAPVHRPHPIPPGRFETGGGKRKLSASRERPIPAHTAGRAGRHSNGTVGREAALPHGVTREQRMLNPLLWQVCGTLGRFRCHAGQAVVRARVPASPSRASRLARTRDGRRDLRPVRPFPPTRPSSTPGGASNRRANCRSGDALAPGATEHKSDYWLVVSAVCSSKSTTSH